jgi:hypothetical protein
MLCEQTESGLTFEAPPYSVATFAFAAGQNLAHSSPIWIASSRVGARMIAAGTTAAGRKRPSTISMSGAAEAPCLTMRPRNIGAS